MPSELSLSRVCGYAGAFATDLLVSAQPSVSRAFGSDMLLSLFSAGQERKLYQYSMTASRGYDRGAEINSAPKSVL